MIRVRTIAWALVVVGALAGVAVAPRSARAQDATMELARSHFERGQDAFGRQEYARAGDEFMRAYEARPFPAFLYNAAVAYEKLKDYPKAIDLFQRYITEDPKARDKADIEKRIKVLKAEVERIKNLPPPSTQPSSQPSTQPVVPSPAEQLPEVRVKGIVVIESKPPGATLFIDDKKKGAVGQTPWNGSLEGAHTVILEQKGYKSEKKDIAPSPDKLVFVYISMAEEHFLGWLEVRANIPGADVYIDRRDVGAVGRTPYMGNIQPGKHHIIVSKDGYTTVEKDIVIDRGTAQNLDVTIQKAPIGFVSVKGVTARGAKVDVDGKKVCDAVPCRVEVKSGGHTVEVYRKGKKTWSHDFDIDQGTEMAVNVNLAPKASHVGDYLTILLGGGVIAGTYFGEKALVDKFPDNESIIKIGSYVTYGLGGVVVLGGIWGLFSDEGPDSSARWDSKDIVLAPTIGPGYGGMAAVGRF